MARTMALAFYNETRKGLLLIWDYKLSMFTQILMFGMIFLGITFLMGDGSFQPDKTASILIGYLVWFFYNLAINDLSWNLMEETQTGTLEQMYMSPAPSGLVVLGRGFARFVFSVVMLVLLGGVLITLLDMQITFRPAALPLFLLILMGVYGFGFAMAGVTLVVKQVGTLANLMGNLLLFLNGTLLPIDKLPDWLAAFSKTLPTTQGIVVLRQVMLGGRTLAGTWQDGSLLYLLVHSSICLALGWMVFKWCENRAKLKGTLGQY
ncbi:MAG: ABC transporter permease [Candidatus Neomarinimicrobiota bacterium]